MIDAEDNMDVEEMVAPVVDKIAGISKGQGSLV